MTVVDLQGNKSTVRAGSALSGERWRSIEITSEDLVFPGFLDWFAEWAVCRLVPW